MNPEKQRLLIEYLLASEDVFSLCCGILNAEYFDPNIKPAVMFLNSYYNEYRSLPSADQVIAESGVQLTERIIQNDKELSYCINEIEAFCKKSAIETAVIKSVPLIDKGEYGAIKELVTDAVLVSLNRNLGVDFFDNMEERLHKLKQQEIYEPTGWSDFDALLDGGLARKQLLLVSANSGGGKSIVMCNLGLNYLLKGFTVLVITLELSEEMVDMRFLQMMSGLGSSEWKRDIHETIRKINNISEIRGDLKIKRMPQGSTSNDIRAYLKEFELKYGKVPDVIISDYVDIMNSNDRISAENVFEKDKAATAELREIGEDYNAIMITASQQNRGAVTAIDLNHSHIAGGISKIDAADVYASIIMNESMRAKGEMMIQFLKTRSSAGVGKGVHLHFNTTSLRITDQNNIDSTVLKPFKEEESDSTDDLLKLGTHL